MQVRSIPGQYNQFALPQTLARPVESIQSAIQFSGKDVVELKKAPASSAPAQPDKTAKPGLARSIGSLPLLPFYAMGNWMEVRKIRRMVRKNTLAPQEKTFAQLANNKVKAVGMIMRLDVKDHVKADLIRPLAHDHHNEFSPRVRKSAIDAIATLNNDELKEELLWFLVHDRDVTVQSYVPTGVRTLKKDVLKEKFLNVLLKDPDTEVRAASVPVISTIRNDSVKESLLKPMLKDEEWAVRDAVPGVISSFESDVTREALLSTMISDEKETSIREKLPETASTFKDNVLKYKNLKSLATDSTSAVRLNVAKVLTRLPESSDKIDCLKTLSKDGSAHVRNEVAAMVPSLTEDGVKTELLKTLIGFKDPAERFAQTTAVRGIASVKDHEQKTALLALAGKEAYWLDGWYQAWVK